MNLSPIALQRLYSHRLIDSPFTQPGEVVGWLGAMQGQDFLGSLWSIGLRLSDATEAMVERAINDRSIVRIWFMRGTLHFIASADVRWMADLIAPRLRLINGPRLRGSEMEAGTLYRCIDLVVKELERGQQRTREELMAALNRAGFEVNGSRLSLIVQVAQVEGLLCYGARRGKQLTFALLDEWVPPAPTLDRDVALVEFARRYFTGHGPATLEDFVAWSGLTLTEARAGLNGAKECLAQETVGGSIYWRSADVTAPTATEPSLLLLSGFDEFVLGYRDRTASLDPQQAPLWNPGNAIFASLIVADGRVIGTWKRALQKSTILIEATPFAPLSADQLQAINDAAHRYANFLDLPKWEITVRS